MRSQSKFQGNISHVATACFVLGLGSWITVNGLYQELPLIAQSAPEGYNVFSYTAVLVALANVWPACFLWARSKQGNDTSSLDHWTTLVSLGVFGVMSCIFSSIFYDSTVFLAGAQRSVPLFVLIFLSGGVDCMTSVLFYPLVAPLPALAVTMLIVGEAATGLLAAALAAVQAAAPCFSVSMYFAALGAVMAASTAAYQWLHVAKHQQPAGLQLQHYTDDLALDSPAPVAVSRRERWRLGGYQALLAFVENGVHAVLLPHAVRAQTYIQWSVHASFAGAALCTLLAHYRPLRTGTLGAHAVHAAIAVTAGATVAAAAVSQPWPALLMSAIVVLCKCAVAFAKTSAFVVLKLPAQLPTPPTAVPPPAHYEAVASQDQQQLLPLQVSAPSAMHADDMQSAYRWGGIGIQVGSCLGAVLFFLLTVVQPVLAAA